MRYHAKNKVHAFRLLKDKYGIYGKALWKALEICCLPPVFLLHTLAAAVSQHLATDFLAGMHMQVGCANRKDLFTDSTGTFCSSSLSPACIQFGTSVKHVIIWHGANMCKRLPCIRRHMKDSCPQQGQCGRDSRWSAADLRTPDLFN